jgi:multidrug efflux system outer membrane protein
MPSKLGVELLARRPDLQAARWRVEASLDRTEVAKAAFYPDINLTGSFGLDAMSLNRLFEADSRTFLVGPVLSLPLFNSKVLQGRLDAARNERNELIADYNQSVLNAVCEVAQAGAALQGIETLLRQQADVMASTGAMLRAAQSRFKHGLADHAKILHAEMTALQQRDIDLQLQHQRLLAEVALTKALGGGYRAGTPETQTTLAHSLN